MSGGLGVDSFILGIETTVFYDDGNATTAGTNNFGYITDFNTSEDFIVLAGQVGDYRLGASPNTCSQAQASITRPKVEQPLSNHKNVFIGDGRVTREHR